MAMFVSTATRNRRTAPAVPSTGPWPGAYFQVAGPLCGNDVGTESAGGLGRDADVLGDGGGDDDALGVGLPLGTRSAVTRAPPEVRSTSPSRTAPDPTSNTATAIVNTINLARRRRYLRDCGRIAT
jgi:hypothetical protein